VSEASRAIRLEPARLVRALAAIAVLLSLAHVVLLVVRTSTGHDTIYGLVRLFDLDREQSIPSFFSGCLFLLNALLFFLIARSAPRSASSAIWPVLPALFLFLAYDELFGIHEGLTKPLRAALHTSGLLFYAWVVVYVPAVVLLVFAFLPVWRRLDRPVRAWLGLAAGTFLLGAVGIEMVGGAYRETVANNRDLTYGLLVTIEESLEMAGLIMLTHALLSLLKKQAGGPPIVIQDPD
jgi:hypothetical protein